MLLQSAAMVAKKLLVEDKITAQLCQTNLSLGCPAWVLYVKFGTKKLSGETVCFLEKRLLSIFTSKFCASCNFVFDAI